MRKIFISIVVFLMVMALGVGYANALPYLVYESGGSQNVIKGAMDKLVLSLGITYDVRSASNAVTADDLATHEALIIGWSAGGFDMSGLDTDILETGITGNKILTGHDADFHTYYDNLAAQTFMERAVLFAGAADDPGILAFPVYTTNPFSYLPSAWGITAFNNLVSEDITAITADGVGSGLYAGLTLADLSNWGNSFHAGFTAWDPSFKSFEIGSPPDDTVVTIGTTVTPVSVPEPSTILLLGSSLIGFVAFRRKFKK